MRWLTDLLLAPLCVLVSHLPCDITLPASLVVVTPCAVWLARHVRRRSAKIDLAI